ncbi:hypothetical protein AOQ71_16795 [Bradyrhizobium manausense]|uniref:Uncharacterized protein n=1 Tax=Bradyrhizobium manausense TaxID=989370 RepID=A0A0R3DS18_9BRAD|nr:hypothetical protein AOQ71_16795 [Bradyrhizobium manausense]
MPGPALARLMMGESKHKYSAHHSRCVTGKQDHAWAHTAGSRYSNYANEFVRARKPRVRPCTIEVVILNRESDFTEPSLQLDATYGSTPNDIHAKLFKDYFVVREERLSD